MSDMYDGYCPICGQSSCEGECASDGRLLTVWNGARSLAHKDSRSPSFDGDVYRFLLMVREWD